MLPAKFLLKALALTSLLSVFTAGCASEADDEEYSESEDRLLAGRRLSEREIARHLRNAGFPENQIGRMVCTAKYESSFYERAQNRNRNGSLDRGLFQINSIHLGGTRGCPSRANASSLWNAETNAECAKAIFDLQGNRAWYGYRKHKTECDNYRAPDSAVDDTPASTSSSSSGATGTEPTEETQGGCWSGTLQDMVDAKVCVQSRNSGVWFQCMDGGWYRGANASTGPFGACAGSHPL